MTYPISYDVPGWTLRKHPSKLAMQGQYCCLQALDIDQHSDALYTALCQSASEHNWIYMPYGPFENRAAFDL